MINLLPTDRKHRLRQERSFRLSAIIGVVLVFSVLAFVLMLLAIWVYIWGAIQEQKIELSAAEQRQERFSDLHEGMEETNDRVGNLRRFYNDILLPSKALERIESHLPQDLYITNIVYTLPIEDDPDDDRVKLSISGYAPTREGLQGMRSALQRDDFFDEVIFPPANWVQEDEIDFAGTVHIPQENLQ